MWSVLSALLPVVLVAAAQAVSPQSPKERYDSLVKEFKSAEEAWDKRYMPEGKATPKDEIEARYRDWPTWSFLPRFMELAEQNPNDAAAVDSLYWIIDQGRAVGLMDRDYYSYLERALDQLKRAHLRNDKSHVELRFVMRRSSPATEKFLRDILEATKDRELRGRACLYLGDLLFNRANLARDPWFDKAAMSPFESFLMARLNPTVVKYIHETDLNASAAEGERLLERAVNEFGDVLYIPRRPGLPVSDDTIADVARNKLNEFRHLNIGRIGPDIDGTDVDGKTLKLSDYRGKVVLLCFWGSWCPPCMALVPHERDLAKRMEGKPFALLGINSDENAGVARKVMDREKMSWRSWWDGRPPGPIAVQWNAGPWPTLYVLDAKGVIRFKGHGEPEGLDAAIDSALKEIGPREKP